MRGKIGVYGAVPIKLLQESNITKIEICVYCALSSFQGVKDNCYPSRVEIGKRAGIDRIASISKALTSLEIRGWITRNITGNGKVNTYSVMHDMENICVSESATLKSDVAESATHSVAESATHSVAESDTSIYNKITYKNNIENNSMCNSEELPAIDDNITPIKDQSLEKNTIDGIDPKDIRAITMKAKIMQDMAIRFYKHNPVVWKSNIPKHKKSLMTLFSRIKTMHDITDESELYEVVGTYVKKFIEIKNKNKNNEFWQSLSVTPDGILAVLSKIATQGSQDVVRKKEMIEFDRVLKEALGITGE